MIQLRKLYIRQILNRFRMLKLFGIAKFQQVSVVGNCLEAGTACDSTLRKLAETENFPPETMRKPYVFLSFSIVKAEFQQR